MMTTDQVRAAFIEGMVETRPEWLDAAAARAAIAEAFDEWLANVTCASAPEE